MGNIRLTIAAAVGLVALGVSGAQAADAKKDWGVYQSKERRSGYTYMTDETRAMQDDPFQNPGMLWLETGKELWDKVDGKAGKSCGSCHGAPEKMKGLATVYPKYDEKLKNIINIENRINQCRTERMGAKAWKYDSKELLSTTILVRHQSLGMRMNVSVDGPAQPFFQKGRDFYYKRRGQLDLACASCHGDHAGGQLRANVLSEGQTNGFPLYRLKWQKVGSVHRRFKGCNSMVRAEPYKPGGQEYLNLELYTAWRGRGLPVETPAVRN